MARICVVTEEFAGITKGGGIGTCARGLALHLSSLGHHVTVLLTSPGMDQEYRSYEPELTGIAFFTLNGVISRDSVLNYQADAIGRAYAVYRFFDGRVFDAVHFNEWQGSGFYVAMSRSQGRFPCPVVTHLHGSSNWVRLHNNSIPDIADFEMEAIEKSQIENSDIVISPSEYLLRFYRERGIRLPKSIQLNWILPQWLEESERSEFETRAVDVGQVRQLIFFGRQERRKGFEIFVDAIKRLPKSMQPDILFLGRFDKIDREYTGSYVLRHLATYAGSIEFKSDLNQSQALQLIDRSRNGLCVMPSAIENSPCTVGECFTLACPFIATDVGGIAELIEPASRPLCLSEYSAVSLSAKLRHVIEHGLAPLRSSLNPKQIFSTWERVHNEILSAEPRAASAAPTESPLVSVCFSHFNRPILLDKAVAGIEQQTYDNIEIIIVDDGSTLPQAIRYLDKIEGEDRRFPIKIIRQENRYLGAARNAGAAAASGEYILFHDDDNIAEPEEVSCLVAAALYSGVDILTSQMYVFTESGQDELEKSRRISYFPIGIGGSFSFLRNRFGDANALFRRQTFIDLGGFSELRGVGWEDWELFLRAYVRGIKMGVVPDPLFNYRASAEGMLSTGQPIKNWERLYSMVESEKPVFDPDIFRYATRGVVGQEVLDKTWNTLAKQPHHEIHHRLTSEDPNSPRAKELLCDLMFALGRTTDAIEMAMASPQQREKLSGLIASRRPAPRLATRSATIVRFDALSGRDGVYMRGWAVDKHGEPFEIDALRFSDRWFEVSSMKRYSRPDVAKALDLKSDQGLGFVAVARPMQDPKYSWLSRSRGVVPFPPSFDGGVARLAGSARGRVKGCIDTAFWYTFMAVPVPEATEWSGGVEVHTEGAAEVAIFAPDGAIDFGQKLEPNRTIFAFDADEMDQQRITFAIPNGTRSEVMFY